MLEGDSPGKNREDTDREEEHLKIFVDDPENGVLEGGEAAQPFTDHGKKKEAAKEEPPKSVEGEDIPGRGRARNRRNQQDFRVLGGLGEKLRIRLDEEEAPFFCRDRVGDIVSLPEVLVADA